MGASMHQILLKPENPDMYFLPKFGLGVLAVHPVLWLLHDYTEKRNQNKSILDSIDQIEKNHRFMLEGLEDRYDCTVLYMRNYNQGEISNSDNLIDFKSNLYKHFKNNDTNFALDVVFDHFEIVYQGNIIDCKIKRITFVFKDLCNVSATSNKDIVRLKVKRGSRFLLDYHMNKKDTWNLEEALIDCVKCDKNTIYKMERILRYSFDALGG